jgi:hypothetical protein
MNQPSSPSLFKMQKFIQSKSIFNLTSLLLVGSLLLTTTASNAAHANNNTKQEIDSKKYVPALVTQTNEYAKTANALALATKEIFVYYKTTFLVGNQRQIDFDFSKIRQYAENADKRHTQIMHDKTIDHALLSIVGKERMDTRDATDILDLIEIINVIIKNTHTMTDIVNLNHPDSSECIAVAVKNANYITTYIALTREEMQRLCKYLFEDKAKDVISKLIKNENDSEVKKELTNLLLSAKSEL